MKWHCYQLMNFYAQVHILFVHIQYALYAEELNYHEWSKEKLQYFAYTIKLKIWNSKNSNFYDFINGRETSIRELRRAGWKQSDGWMKLMKVDKSLKPIYLKFYINNKDYIDNSYLNSQFYSVFARYM